MRMYLPLNLGGNVIESDKPLYTGRVTIGVFDVDRTLIYPEYECPEGEFAFERHRFESDARASVMDAFRRHNVVILWSASDSALYMRHIAPFSDADLFIVGVDEKKYHKDLGKLHTDINKVFAYEDHPEDLGMFFPQNRVSHVPAKGKLYQTYSKGIPSSGSRCFVH